jgi:molybdate transport system regulatory protein
MNKLKAKIVHIDSNNHLSLVDLAVGNDVISATLLETPAQADYLKIGNQVSILFKETEVSLAKNLSGLISLRNRLKATVTKIERGEILSAVTLAYQGNIIVSVITTRGMDTLQLEEGDEVEALIKANEVVLSDDV